MSTKIETLEQLLDRTALFDLVRHERLFRDTQSWDAMANCYSEDSHVGVSWYNGNGKGFAAASRQQWEAGKGKGMHIIQPLRLWLNGDRALIESHGEIMIRTVKGGRELEISSYCRFVSRARREGSDWKLLSFDSIFLRDTMQAIFHDEELPVDWDALRDARRPTRFLTWLVGSDYDEQPDIIAIDEPEKVAAFYDSAQKWVDHAVG